MKKSANTIYWIGVVVFGVMAITSLGLGGFLGALLFLLGGLIIAPLGFVQKLRSKLKLNKALSIVLAVVLLLSGTFAMPTSEVPTDNTGTQIAGTVSDGSSDPNKNADTSTLSTSETTSKTEDTSSKEETASKPENTSNPESTSNHESTSKSTETQSTACSHTETTVKNKANATCTENGYSGDTYCNACNKVIKTGSQIKATGHNTEVRNKKDATTTSEGYTGDTYCKICGVKTATGKVIPKMEDNTQQETNSQTVYITKTGKKYHSTKNCSGLNNANEIYDSTLSEAQAKGLTPCSKCY